MKSRKESIEKSGDYLSAWGNENIIRNHIAYFEKQLDKEIAEQRSLVLGNTLAYYPNFAAWIRFYTELICNSLYWRLLRSEGDWDNVSEMTFSMMRERIFKKIRHYASTVLPRMEESSLANMTKSLDLVLNLRHSFQHGGLPNLMRKLTFNISEDEFLSMLDPNSYGRTKVVFREAEKCLSFLPQLTVVFYMKKDSAR